MTVAVEQIPFTDLVRGAPLAEIRAAIDDVIRDGCFVGGSAVAGFEADFARYCGAEHCVGVSSGTSALQAALTGCGVGPGDEVITVSATFVATVAAIVHTGAVPVFADITPGRHTMDPAQVGAAVTERTRAIVPVDLYGHPADLAPLLDLARRHDLVVIADSAQAHGSRYRGRSVGAVAHATCFSFYPSKNLGGYGDAGAVTTDDAQLADRIRRLRDHGRAAGSRDEHHLVGHNWRLDAIQAAVLRVKLRYLDHWTALRREVAARYATLLADTGVELPTEAADSRHSYHLYVVRHPNRDALRAGLAARGVAARVHFPHPVHTLPPYQRFHRRSGALPETETLFRRCLSLPMFPGLTELEMDRVAAALIEALQDHTTPRCPGPRGREEE